MTTKIANVANLAFHTFQQLSLCSAAVSASTMAFNSGNNESLSQNITITTSQSCLKSVTSLSTAQQKQITDSLQKLLSSVRSLTPKDVGFDIYWVSDSNVYAAPVAYVHIMENEVFSMGIFILRPGSRIPLHDHPKMYGILRVLYGSLRCRSFTPLRNIKATDLKQANSSFSVFAGSKWQFTDLVVARPHQDTILSLESSPQLLYPVDGNLHEITPVEGPAVFLDILAPPYDHDLGTRECRFYKEVVLPQSFTSNNNSVFLSNLSHSNNNSRTESNIESSVIETSDSDQDGHTISQADDTNNIVYLVETNQPTDYWCESAEYVGPSVV